MTAQPAPKMDASERAARDLLNRRVRQGVFDRRNANQVLKTGLPLVRAMLATWRKDGCSPEWITSKFQGILTDAEAKLAAATTPTARRIALTRVVGAEMYLAVWAGMQADYAAFVNKRRRPAPEGLAVSATHIRQRIARKRGNSFYRVNYSAAEDGSRTLCGGQPTDRDMAWGECRFAKALAYVTCDECKQLRAGAE